MTFTKIALGLAAAAAFAVPAEAQIWTKVPTGRTTTNGDRVLRRAEQTHDGARCELIEVRRNGRAEVERLCDYDRDGVFGDRDDRRIESDRRNRGYGVYASNRDGRNRGQIRAAEVHARNEARKRDQERERRQRELLKERQKREREIQERRQSGDDRDHDDDDRRWP